MSFFRPDYSGLGQMLRSPEMQAEMVRRARLVKAAAEAAAPVYERGSHPGRYKRSFRIVSGVRRGKTARAYARVLNDAPEAFLVEYGSKNNPRHRILGKALDAAKG